MANHPSGCYSWEHDIIPAIFVKWSEMVLASIGKAGFRVKDGSFGFFVVNLVILRFNKQKIDIYLNFLNSLFLFREKMEKQSQKGPLITGKDLKEKLLFPPGPVMGRVLRMINQLFLCGTIKTKAEAFELAQKFLNPKKK